MPEGVWEMEMFKDDSSSDFDPSKYVHVRLKVRSGERIVVRMARGGGFVARFSK
jgi:hypothetical protein